MIILKKYSLFLFLSLCIINVLLAQDTLKNSLEVGLNLFNVTTNGIPSDPLPDNYLSVNTANGVFIKLHYSKISLRISGEHYSYFGKINAGMSDVADTISNSYKYKNILVSMGVERTIKKLRNKAFQFYYGADAVLVIGDFSSQNYSTTGLTNYAIIKSQTGLGLNAFAGIRITAWKFLTFSYEPSFCAIVFKENENKITSLPNAEEKNNTLMGFESRPNPVNRLSLSFRIPVN